MLRTLTALSIFLAEYLVDLINSYWRKNRLVSTQLRTIELIKLKRKADGKSGATPLLTFNTDGSLVLA